MGGEGSGRKPSPETIIKRMYEPKTAIGGTGAADGQFFLPNVSNVMNSVRKDMGGDFEPTGNIILDDSNYLSIGDPVGERLKLYKDGTSNYIESAINSLKLTTSRDTDLIYAIINGTTRATLSPSTLLLNTGSITDSTGNISFGDENLTTTGQINVGDSTLTDNGYIELICATGAGVEVVQERAQNTNGDNVGGWYWNSSTNKTIFYSDTANALEIVNTSGVKLYGDLNLNSKDIDNGGTLNAASANLTSSLYLPNTTSSTTGIIFKNNSRFFHDYTGSGQAGQNIFVGLNSGNFTMSGTTYQSSYNMGFGSQTLTNLTTGSGNVGIGYYALQSCTSGDTNMAIGASALRLVTTNGFNVAIGGSAGYNTTGGNNVLIGYQAGYTGTGYSSNVFLGLRAGYYETGSNTLFIDNQSRTNEATARVSSLVYGTFSSTVANQTFKINGQFLVNDDKINIGTSKTPASAAATGTAGTICWDSSYIYVCTATNTWKRAAISTW